MEKKLISIILPVYNVDKYLKKSIESIVNQTYSNFEILIINDGSTDNSEEICKEYICKDERIKYFYQENRGVSAARNYGIDMSEGEFIIFIDSDDYLEPDMLEKLYKNVLDNNCDISICNYALIKNNDRVENITEKIPQNILTKNEFIKFMFSDKYYRGYLWNKLIKKDVIANIRFDTKLHVMEDMIFLLDISNNIEKAYFEENVFLYNYLQNSESILHNFSEKHFSAVNSYKKIFDYIEKNKFEINQDDYYMICENYIFIFMNYYYYLYKNKKLTKEIKNEKVMIRKQYLKKALLKKAKITRKLKLLNITYFPIIYGETKKKIRSV